MAVQRVQHRASDQDDELLTIAEVADILRLPIATLRYWRTRQIGPDSFRIGRGVRYWRSTVYQWLGEQSQGGDPHMA